MLVWGREVNNAVSWFSVFGFQFQPSEWAKPAIIVMLALPSLRAKIMAVTSLYAIALVSNIVCMGFLGWKY